MRSVVVLLLAALLLATASCGESSSSKPPDAPTVNVPPIDPKQQPQPADPAAAPTATTTAAVEEHPPAPAPTPTAPSQPPMNAGGPPFNRGAAAQALGSVKIQSCARPHGVTGAGHVTVTFDPSGVVSAATVDAGAYPGTPEGSCIAGLFRNVHVPPFSGSPTRVGKSFTLP